MSVTTLPNIAMQCSAEDLLRISNGQLPPTWLPMPMSASVAPPAIRICACTRSMPVTSSVHVCSTCAWNANPYSQAWKMFCNYRKLGVRLMLLWGWHGLSILQHVRARVHSRAHVHQISDMGHTGTYEQRNTAARGSEHLRTLFPSGTGMTGNHIYSDDEQMEKGPHLDARVDLQEVIAAVLVHHELHCARVLVAHVSACVNTPACQAFACSKGEGVRTWWLAYQRTAITQSLRCGWLASPTTAVGHGDQ